MAELLPLAQAAANSIDFTVTTAAPVGILLKSAETTGKLPHFAYAAIQMKSSGLQYFTVAEVTQNCPAVLLNIPGTYRVSKNSNQIATGVDKTQVMTVQRLALILQQLPPTFTLRCNLFGNLEVFDVLDEYRGIISFNTNSLEFIKNENYL